MRHRIVGEVWRFGRPALWPCAGLRSVMGAVLTVLRVRLRWAAWLCQSHIRRRTRFRRQCDAQVPGKQRSHAPPSEKVRYIRTPGVPETPGSWPFEVLDDLRPAGTEHGSDGNQPQGDPAVTLHPACIGTPALGPGGRRIGWRRRRHRSCGCPIANVPTLTAPGAAAPCRSTTVRSSSYSRRRAASTFEACGRSLP